MSVYQEAYKLPEFKYEYERLKVDVRGPIHVVSFDDAANLNAMSYQQMADFNNYLKQVRMDPECRVIVLTGEGKSFCAGFNLNELNYEPPEDMGRAQRDHGIMQTVCSDQAVNMRACPQPIIGALKGHAIGGGLSLSCACDLRVLGESYKMQAGYLNIGLTGTDMSGSYYLPRIVGFARAMEALTTARRIGAEELLEWGFANKVVSDDEVVEAAVAMAEAMIKNSAPLGLRLTKEALQASLDNSFGAQITLENRNQVLASQTEDARRGVRKMNPKLRDEVKEHPENFAFSNK